MQREDYKTDVIMYLKQIDALASLMLETDNSSQENLLTIQNLSKLGLELADKL